MNEKVLCVLQSVLVVIVLALAMVVTAFHLKKVLLGTGVPEKHASKRVEAALMDRFDMRMNNDISNALEGVLRIEKSYWLNDSDLIAPKPNPDNYGITDDPSSLQWLLDEAGDMLDVEDFVFNTEIQIYDGSSIMYYLDETIFAITWQEFVDNIIYTYSEVKIAHPSQFRRFLAGGTYGSDKQFYTTQMASDVNAVVASAGDFYKYRSLGVIVYDGIVMRADSTYLETCYIDDKGDLIFSHKGELATREEAEKYVTENHIRFSLAFGPILIENGVNCVPHHYVLGEIDDQYPRSALCQMDELHYLVVVAGRDEGNYNMGVPTLREFAEQIALTGCEKAYTLDGGQTATIAMNGQMMNPVQYGSQRLISDIFYFATALPNGE